MTKYYEYEARYYVHPQLKLFKDSLQVTEVTRRLIARNKTEARRKAIALRPDKKICNGNPIIRIVELVTHPF